MSSLYTRSAILAVAITSLTINVAPAQLCFDIFSADEAPILQCADTNFFLAPTNGGFENSINIVGSNSGMFSAAYNGDDMFTPGDPDRARPANVLDPFFSSAVLTTATGAMGATTSFTTTHRGNVRMAPADSVFQSSAFNSRSRVTFIPVRDVTSAAPLPFMLDIDFMFSLTDPIVNAGAGAALGGVAVNLFGADDGPLEDPLFDFSGLVELDIDNVSSEPEFFGFDDPNLDGAMVVTGATPVPGTNDQFDIGIQIQVPFTLGDFGLDPDEAIVLEIESLGSVFSDGYTPGDAAPWEMSNPNTLNLTVSSEDAGVRFQLVPEPSTGLLLLLSAGGVGFLRRRRQAMTGPGRGGRQ